MARAGADNAYEIGLERNPANYVPLTPLSFIERTAAVYPQRRALVHGARTFTWAETYRRCRRLASALAQHGIGVGDTVAAMLANTPEMYEAHFGVPMVGAVLNTLKDLDRQDPEISAPRAGEIRECHRWLTLQECWS
jgi:fatty-acyl-CoA synthase